jgi:penicillin-binding protein 1A
MEALLVKIFATALALSRVTTTPDAVKTQFDRTGDQQEVARLLSAGCTHMRKAFDIEDINLDELIATAMDDPQAMTSENKVFAASVLPICKRPTDSFARTRKCRRRPSTSARSSTITTRRSPTCPITTSSRASSFRARASCSTARASASRRCSRRTSGANGCRSQRSRKNVQKAFLAAEDKRFYRHKGIDERGLIRAFIGNLAQSGRPQGGSTITQQIAPGRRGPHL